jgi:hypothetical protein
MARYSPIGLAALLLTLGVTSAWADATAWDGEESPPRGKGWTRPASCRVEPVAEAPHGGAKCLRVDLKGDGWKGVGWNWFGWYPPDAGTDARGASDLVFWLKASRADAALQLRLVDNRKGSSGVVDLREKGILDALPTAWREVRVPLSAFEGVDAGRLWEIHLGTPSPGDLTLWVDDIGFARSKGSQAADSGRAYAVRVTVEAGRPLHAISPFIYGASAVEPKKAKQYGLTTVRWGGNRSSRYNWKARADNAGSDWFFLNGRAGPWADFLAGDRKAGLASYLTVPMLPWVAKGPEGWGFSVAKYGPQQKVEPYVADRGNGRKPDGTAITGNDPRDTSVPSTPAFQAEGIRAVLGEKKGGPPVVYGLDNEPMLWHETHRDVHPEPVSYDEAARRGRELALAIKQADPDGLVAGPCTWGWTDLNYSAADAGSDRYATHADRRAHGDMPFLAWYLKAMHDASKSAGRRLLDLVDVHAYPQGQADGQGVYGGKSRSAAMRALRLRSTRALWDPSYRDESWINEPVALIPRVRGWVEANYPGTKLCVGEYNWGGDDDPSGAIAQAEILGIFARERVDHAYFWAGLDGVQRFAFQLYRNPDGSGSGRGFGDRHLATRSDAPDRLAAFAARRDDGALTVVLINKDLDRPAEVRLDAEPGPKPVGTLFRLPNPPGPIRKEVLGGKGPAATITVPPLSAAMLVSP